MKVLVRVSNDIQIKSDTLPPKIRDAIFKELTLPNPSFIQAERMDKYTGHLEKYIYLYESRGDALIIPRGFIYRLLKLLKDAGQDYKIEDNRLLLPPVDFHSKIKLMDYQIPAVERLTRFGNGGLVGGCGSGKTQMALETGARLGQPIIWITHTKELAQQAIERACLCFEDMNQKEVGFIGDGKISIGKRLTVALVQTLSKIDMEGITDKFGTVIIDEGHHIAASSFLVPIGKFPARYRLWCTATPTREDGLTGMVLASGGPILYTIQDKDLPTVTPQLRIIETAYSGYVDIEDYPGMLGDLIRNDDRNRLIIETITREAPDHYSLILSDRIEHLTTLKAILEESLPDLSIEILNGKLPKKQRTAIMEKAKARQVDILLATQLAREGLDLPHLDRLFLVSPKKALAATEQEIGRIRRPCDNKPDAMVFDFWDTGNPVFKSQFWKRKAVYAKLGINVDLNHGIQRILRQQVS